MAPLSSCSLAGSKPAWGMLWCPPRLCSVDTFVAWTHCSTGDIVRPRTPPLALSTRSLRSGPHGDRHRSHSHNTRGASLSTFQGERLHVFHKVHGHDCKLFWFLLVFRTTSAFLSPLVKFMRELIAHQHPTDCTSSLAHGGRRILFRTWSVDTIPQDVRFGYPSVGARDYSTYAPKTHLRRTGDVRGFCPGRNIRFTEPTTERRVTNVLFPQERPR